MESVCNDIVANCMEFSWHGRGGWNITDVLNMSPGQRKMISAMIERHMEITKNNKMPYF